MEEEDIFGLEEGIDIKYEVPNSLPPQPSEIPSELQVKIRQDLKPFFKQDFSQCILPDGPDSGKPKFLCLINSCKAKVSFDKRQGWCNFIRHMNRIHPGYLGMGTKKVEKPKKKNISKPFRRIAPKPVAVEEGTEKSLRTSERIASKCELLPIVKLERIDDDIGSNSIGNEKIICAICGRIPERRAIIEQKTKKKENDEGSLSGVICKLLQIPIATFLPFFKNKKYCGQCLTNIQNVKEDFANLDKIQLKISECKQGVENSLKQNYNHLANDDKIISRLLKEIGGVEEENDKIGNFDTDGVDENESEEEGEEAEALDDPDYLVESDYEEMPNTSEGIPEVVVPKAKSKSHKKKSKGEGHLKCEVEGCLRSFTTVGGRTLHMDRIHAQPNDFKCVICAANGIDKRFTNKNSLSYHRRSKHLMTINRIYAKFLCEICGKCFKSPKSVEIHKVKVHTDGWDDPACLICSLRFPTEEELRAHASTHKSSTPFLCVLCQALTTSSVELKAHVQSVHSEVVGSTRLRCEWAGCQLTFESETTLRDHMIRHRSKAEENPNPFTCKECKAFCRTKHELSLHMISHSDAKEFACDECPAAFKYKKGLKFHKNRHAVLKAGGKFKYECLICPKSFESKQRLQKHEEIHAGVQHTCEVCGKGFGAGQNLAQHLKIHFGPHPPKRKSKTKEKTVVEKSIDSNGQLS